MAMSPVTVNVDLGIAETARLVDEIISRRRQRKQQVVPDVLDDVEAAVAPRSTRGCTPRSASGTWAGSSNTSGRADG
jgi:hypothetical protein